MVAQTMAADGYYKYNLHSALQQRAAQPSLKALQAACLEMPLPDPGAALYIADLGCSQGKNSVEAMRVVMRTLATRVPPGERLSVMVAHEDLPANDFHSLFELLEVPSTSYIPDRSTCSPEEARLDVYSVAVGKSFYERLFPSSSVHLTYAATTLHWMSSVPARPTDAVHAYLSDDAAVVEAAREQGRKDVANFLTLRAAEMPSGAPLIFHMPVLATDPAAPDIPHIFVHRVVRQMLASGRLKPSEVAAMTAHEYYRPACDVTSIIEQSTSDWRQQSVEEHSIELPGYAEYARGEVTLAELVDVVVGMLRAAFANIYVGHLSLTRPKAEATALVEELFKGAEQLVAAEPTVPTAIQCIYVWLWRR